MGTQTQSGNFKYQTVLRVRSKASQLLEASRTQGAQASGCWAATDFDPRSGVAQHLVATASGRLGERTPNATDTRIG